MQISNTQLISINNEVVVTLRASILVAEGILY
jgi:hypothetical protein